MNAKVVDTNVLVVANGGHPGASAFCRLASIETLNTILSSGRIVVDVGNEIYTEYKTYCNPNGQPGVGDLFFREVLLNYAGKVLRVDLPKNADGSFVNFPKDAELRNFDKSDRKFVAAAVVTGAPVVNATDTDWLNHKQALANNGIGVEFVCTDNKNNW